MIYPNQYRKGGAEMREDTSWQGSDYKKKYESGVWTFVCVCEVDERYMSYCDKLNNEVVRRAPKAMGARSPHCRSSLVFLCDISTLMPEPASRTVLLLSLLLLPLFLLCPRASAMWFLRVLGARCSVPSFPPELWGVQFVFFFLFVVLIFRSVCVCRFSLYSCRKKICFGIFNEAEK